MSAEEFDPIENFDPSEGIDIDLDDEEIEQPPVDEDPDIPENDDLEGLEIDVDLDEEAGGEEQGTQDAEKENAEKENQTPESDAQKAVEATAIAGNKGYKEGVCNIFYASPNRGGSWIGVPYVSILLIDFKVLDEDGIESINITAQHAKVSIKGRKLDHLATLIATGKLARVWQSANKFTGENAYIDAITIS